MRLSLISWLIITAVFFVSCIADGHINGGNDQSVTLKDTPNPAKTFDPEVYEIGENANIEKVEIVFLESFPLQVHALVSGNLPDGCTGVHRSESWLEGNTLIVKIFTQREKNVICTQALVPFEHNVPLDVYGFSAGTYRVKIYDVEAEFTFTQDNIIKEASGGG